MSGIAGMVGTDDGLGTAESGKDWLGRVISGVFPVIGESPEIHVCTCQHVP